MGTGFLILRIEFDIPLSHEECLYPFDWKLNSDSESHPNWIIHWPNDQYQVSLQLICSQLLQQFRKFPGNQKQWASESLVYTQCQINRVPSRFIRSKQKITVCPDSIAQSMNDWVTERSVAEIHSIASKCPELSQSNSVEVETKWKVNTRKYCNNKLTTRYVSKALRMRVLLSQWLSESLNGTEPSWL